MLLTPPRATRTPPRFPAPALMASRTPSVAALEAISQLTRTVHFQDDLGQGSQASVYTTSRDAKERPREAKDESRELREALERDIERTLRERRAGTKPTKEPNAKPERQAWSNAWSRGPVQSRSEAELHRRRESPRRGRNGSPDKRPARGVAVARYEYAQADAPLFHFTPAKGPRHQSPARGRQTAQGDGRGRSPDGRARGRSPDGRRRSPVPPLASRAESVEKRVAFERKPPIPPAPSASKVRQERIATEVTGVCIPANHDDHFSSADDLSSHDRPQKAHPGFFMPPRRMLASSSRGRA